MAPLDHKFCLTQVLAAALILSIPGPSKAGGELADCLFSEGQPDSSKRATKCEIEDPLGLSKDRHVQAAIAAFGLTNPLPKFFGCPGARFRIRVTKNTKPHSYAIEYPSDAGLTKTEFVAPITHELAHAYQLQSTGSIDKLVDDAHDIVSVELGADFLAGFIYGRHLQHLDRTSLEHSLNLTGDYRDKEDHGQPPDRTAAFKLGYSVKPYSGLAGAYRRFQRDDVGAIRNANK